MVSFLMILIIIFVSPLYFLMRRKWLGFIGNLILYFVALVTLPIFGIGVFFWLLAVGHASFAYRKEELEETTTMMANKMATAIVAEQERKDH